MPSGILNRITPGRTDDSEKESPSSSGFRRKGFHSCYRGITVVQHSIEGLKFIIEERCPVGCFHGDVKFRCLFGLHVVKLWIDTFSETSGRTKATRYKVPEGIYSFLDMF
jgi:hypothetical protein